MPRLREFVHASIPTEKQFMSMKRWWPYPSLSAKETWFPLFQWKIKTEIYFLFRSVFVWVWFFFFKSSRERKKKPHGKFYVSFFGFHEPHFSLLGSGVQSGMRVLFDAAGNIFWIPEELDASNKAGVGPGMSDNRPQTKPTNTQWTN